MDKELQMPKLDDNPRQGDGKRVEYKGGTPGTKRKTSVCVILARPPKTKEGPRLGLYWANPESMFYVDFAHVSTLPNFLDDFDCVTKF